MRILMVVIDFPALSETFVLDQITGLIDRGFDVDILASRAREESTVHSDVDAYGLLDRVRYVDDRVVPGGSRLVRWSRILFDLVRRGQLRLLVEAVRAGLDRALKRPLLVGALQLVAYARTLKTLPTPDLVLCHFGPTGDLMVRLRKVFDARWPVATFFHGYDLSVLLDEKGLGIYNQLLREGDFFFPVSSFFHKRLVKMGAAANRTAVQRMGVRPQTAWRQTMGDPAREFSFVSVGRLVEKKGLEFAIRAIARCRQMNPEIKMNLCIVGDGPLLERFRDIVVDLKLEDVVCMYGSVPREEVQARLLAANAFVLPSVTTEAGDIEGIPVAISEAMAMGLPIVSTYHSGIPEIVEHGVNGLLVPERNIHALAEAMCHIARDRGLAYRLGQAGRAKVERDLNLDRWNDVLTERIRMLTGALRAAE
jgi:colanic acid/amylovoran/stewartan biosynthesis glycosyltransferase WcaL/AmsK/CpsK